MSLNDASSAIVVCSEYNIGVYHIVPALPSSGKRAWGETTSSSETASCERTWSFRLASASAVRKSKACSQALGLIA